MVLDGLMYGITGGWTHERRPDCAHFESNYSSYYSNYSSVRTSIVHTIVALKPTRDQYTTLVACLVPSSKPMYQDGFKIFQ